jgi:hypothetical protein
VDLPSILLEHASTKMLALCPSSFDEQGCKGCNPLTGF